MTRLTLDVFAGLWDLQSLAAILPAHPNYPLRDPKYHLIRTAMLFIEVH